MARVIGWEVFRPVYLNACEVRALSLRSDTPLGTTLNRLYPGQDPTKLDSAQLDCVAAVLRNGWTETAERSGKCKFLERPARPEAQHVS